MSAIVMLLTIGSVFIDVRGGAVDVEDWIAQAPAQVKPPASVWELDDAGEPARAVASQLDGDIVAFHVPGTLAANQTRRFAIVNRETQAPFERVLRTTTTKDIITVERDSTLVQHYKSRGGLPARITVDGRVAPFSFNDKIYDGTVYYGAHQSALHLKVASSGPLRIVVESQARFGAKGQVDSDPRATYRFTYLAGQPVVGMTIDFEQDFARGWRSAHAFEMQIGEAPLTHVGTDQGSGRLEQAGKFYAGTKYAAVYGEHHLLAALGNRQVGVYDGGGRHYGAYLRLGTEPWATTRHRVTGTLFIGRGAADLKATERWSRLLADPPTVMVRLPALEKRLAGVAGRLKGVDDLVAGMLARRHWQAARRTADAGRFNDAAAALDACEAAITAKADAGQLQTAGELEAGIVRGHPYISSARAAYLFAPPDAGGGLINIHDRAAGRDLLSVDPKAAPLWQVAMKGVGFDNIGSPCRVDADVSDEAATLRFTWQRDINVTVAVRLNRGDALLRCRMKIDTPQNDRGLTSVTFPVIDGIVPISDADEVLETWGLGWQKPAPLRSGAVSSTNYPLGMQFSALIGDGRGLYVAEEDPTAAKKDMTWTPAPGSSTTRYSIAHPVLDFAGEQPVREYELPGDVVFGPFAGDWYDAAQLYRQWAITAPWARKGPIHQRDDYPDWLKRAPYFTIGYLGDEHDIERVYKMHEFYDVPQHVAHTYNYYIMQHQDGKYPEHFPPKLGSANFKRVVREMQTAGIHIVPYVNGWVWDQDTESYRTTDAARDGALLNQEGKPTSIMTSYGGGHSLVGMCPATKLWRQQLLHISKELVGRYGVHGIYYDFFTVHTHDCYGGDIHGHANGGGDFWSRKVRETYAMLRREMKKLYPDVMLCGEDTAEWTIDLLDTVLESGKVATTAPLLHAVYGDYTNVFGGQQNSLDPVMIGRTFLLGMQCGWFGPEWSYAFAPQYAHLGNLYRKLIRCRWHFAWPYLSTGRMLRPPVVTGDLPMLTGKSTYGDYHIRAVEASAWQAPDGSLGVFILNHEDKPHDISWSMHVAPGGWRVTQWHEDKGEMPAGELPGPMIQQQTTIGPRELIALKLEASP